jgi:osmoprotectant transport system permease protein
VDVIDIYTTDAKIGHLGLKVLQDDKGLLSALRRAGAVPAGCAAALSRAWAALQQLAAASTRRR